MDYDLKNKIRFSVVLTSKDLTENFLAKKLAELFYQSRFFQVSCQKLSENELPQGSTWAYE